MESVQKALYVAVLTLYAAGAMSSAWILYRTLSYPFSPGKASPMHRCIVFIMASCLFWTLCAPVQALAETLYTSERDGSSAIKVVLINVLAFTCNLALFMYVGSNVCLAAERFHSLKGSSASVRNPVCLFVCVYYAAMLVLVTASLALSPSTNGLSPSSRQIVPLIMWYFALASSYAVSAITISYYYTKCYFRGRKLLKSSCSNGSISSNESTLEGGEGDDQSSITSYQESNRKRRPSCPSDASTQIERQERILLRNCIIMSCGMFCFYLPMLVNLGVKVVLRSRGEDASSPQRQLVMGGVVFLMALDPIWTCFSVLYFKSELRSICLPCFGERL
ncbi:hypothetical protein BJ741DRAFT_593421 [Chytriomyces cf. hyalinus JEL632]|nr:hypothetical protein BJ741DRAFT_593421 [Chytriomyces cf. hyalinus JEL632]